MSLVLYMGKLKARPQSEENLAKTFAKLAFE